MDRRSGTLLRRRTVGVLGHLGARVRSYWVGRRRGGPVEVMGIFDRDIGDTSNWATFRQNGHSVRGVSHRQGRATGGFLPNAGFVDGHLVVEVISERSSGIVERQCNGVHCPPRGEPVDAVAAGSVATLALFR